MKYLNIDESIDWCGGCHVTGFTEGVVNQPDFPSLQTIMEEVAKVEKPSFFVTVNVEEVKVIEWLKKHKFRKGPTIKNWGHGGRKTLFYFKQIPGPMWKKLGRFYGYIWNDYY